MTKKFQKNFQKNTFLSFQDYKKSIYYFYTKHYINVMKNDYSSNDLKKREDKNR